MTRLFPLLLLLLCACAGSLVDHSGATLSGGGTPACVASCTTAVPGATPLCIGDTCTYECHEGKLKCASGCCDASAISAGTGHTCAVAGGEARCWGANDQGQLGRAGAASYVPVQAAVTGTVSAIAAGSTHTCAIAGGEVWCWGDNTYGQLGTGTTTSSATPQKVPNLSGTVLLAAGGAHTCAANATKTFCWGKNDLGQIGNDASLPDAPRLEPTEVVGVSGPLAIAAGDSHTCAASGSGVSCWGANSAGQLGNGTQSAGSSMPGAVSPAVNATFLGLGANHSCAGTGSGELWCWGANGAQQLGVSGGDQVSPHNVMSGVQAVVGGLGHTCAIRTSQTMRCWGLNDRGQLGSTRTDDNQVDVQLAGVQAAAAGYKHTCGVANGSVLCWGLNDRGQLGADPAATASAASPTAVSGR